MKMPKFVKIGTQKWEIKEVPRNQNSDFAEGTYGHTMDKDNIIVLDADMPTTRKQTTLFHEILHAIRFTYAGATTPTKNASLEDWEHYFIGLYEQPFISVLYDNPSLVTFLLGKDD